MPLTVPGRFSPVIDPSSDQDRAFVEYLKRYFRVRQQHGVPSELEDDAWRRFHDQTKPLVHGIVAKRLARQASDDAEQEVWAALIDRIPGFDLDPRRGRFQDWVLTVARSALTDFLRSRHSRQARSLTAEVANALPARDRAIQATPKKQMAYGEWATRSPKPDGTSGAPPQVSLTGRELRCSLGLSLFFQG